MFCVVAFIPAAFRSSGFGLQAASAQLGGSLSSGPGNCTYYNPITDLSSLQKNTTISGLKVPDGAAYACAYYGGGGYQFFDETGKYVGDTTGGLGTNTVNRDQNNNPKPAPVVCYIAWNNMSALMNPVCWGRAIGSVIGGAAVYIASWFLTISGVLFNWVLNLTVAQFGDFMTKSVIEAITTAWTAFRDISNIIIIGMFTFIAISIILGLQEFGQKKLIAHVLIIAILINFSLLFTKMAIDASNFVALQFYNAALNQTIASGGATATAANSITQQGIGNCDAKDKSQCYGIAGAFMDYAGVSGFGDTAQAIRKLADSSDNGFVALLFAAFTSILFLGAAAILFYGTFLLVSRGVLFIFLMAVSSLAFASYLVPVWNKSNYGFGAWKDSLLKNALLAPLMIMFLWMTLNVANAMKIKGGTLGNLLAKPTSTLDINALFGYIVVLGLLFISFRLSSHLAGKISGFSLASMATALPLGLASRFVAAPLLRFGVGLPSYFGSKNLAASAKEDRKEMARRLRQVDHFGANTTAGRIAQREADRLKQSATRKAGLASRLDSLAGGRFNAMDTGVMKAAAKAVGVSGFAAGASSKATLEKSIADQIKTRAEQAEKVASKYAPSADDNEKARTEAREQMRRTRELGLQQLEATRNAEKANADAVKAFEQLPQKLATAQQHLRSEEEATTGNKVRIDEALRAGAITQAQHQNQMRAENERIKRAQAAVDIIQKRIEVLDKPVKEADKSAKDYQKITEKQAEDSAKEAVAALGEAGQEIALKIGQKSGDIVSRAIGSVTGINKEVGSKTKDLYKKKIKTASLRDVMADLKGDEPAAPTPPAAPPAGGPHP